MKTQAIRNVVLSTFIMVIVFAAFVLYDFDSEIRYDFSG